MYATLDLDEAAKAAVGNWRQFESFGWHEQPDDPGDWTIVYTHTRDSGLLDQSNAAAIEKALEPFLGQDDPDVYSEHHGHWACGWVDGYAIRVYRDGKVTDAFKVWFDLCSAMEDYPVLDEMDYSNREYEATLENFDSAAGQEKFNYELPDDWKEQAFTWFWDNDQRAVENRDDQGGWPSEEQFVDCFEGLGFEYIGEDEDEE